MRHLLAATFACLISSAAQAQAPWVEDPSKSMRIGFKAEYQEASAFKSLVTTRRDGSQRDTLSLGNLGRPEPVAWITFQSAPRPITYGGSAVDNVVSQHLQGASFSRDQRQSYSVGTTWGSADITQAAVTLSDGSKRDCAVWLAEAGSGSRMFWGYYCSGRDQTLKADDVKKALTAVIQK
jgi:hypothetical protein